MPTMFDMSARCLPKTDAALEFRFTSRDAGGWTGERGGGHEELPRSEYERGAYAERKTSAPFSQNVLVLIPNRQQTAASRMNALLRSLPLLSVAMALRDFRDGDSTAFRETRPHRQIFLRRD
jgi:hypothetical protein